MDTIDIKKYFSNKTDTTSNNFINFRTINMTIGNSSEMDYDIIYFRFTNKHLNSYSTYSNIEIMGQKDNQEPVDIATFFRKSNTTFGLTEMFKNESYLDKMKLKVLMKNRINCEQWNMEIEIYIDKTFLLNLYMDEKIPKFLFKIIEENCENFYKSKYDYKILIPPQDLYINNLVIKQYKRNLYNYQNKNINWMMEIENGIDNMKCIKTYELPKEYYIYNIPNINEKLICNNERRICNIDNLPNIDILLKGGVLSDDIGLGKTFSMLGLITEQLHKNINNTTLLICPSRLCKQWVEEITKTYDLKYKLIGNIRQFKKLTPEIYNENDIIIISYNFLNNANYIAYSEENPLNEILFENYNWNRVILDEGHEIINESRKKGINEIKNKILNIKSKYRWICSGTPFNNIYTYKSILSYITNINFEEIDMNLYRHNMNYLTETMFRKNTKESVNQEVTIPEPNIVTEFLNMSQLERTIYDSALGDKDKQIELCNHIMVSDEHLSVLGNKPLSLDEIHTKMTAYYKNKEETLEKRIIKNKEEIEKINNQIENMEEKLLFDTITQEEKYELFKKKQRKINDLDLEKEKIQENENQIITVKSKLNIFNSINEKLEEEETCPICLEELEDLTKTITPCGHIYCANCINDMKNKSHNHVIKCAMCRNNFKLNEVVIVKSDIETNDKPVLGTKLEHLIKTLKDILSSNNQEKIIVFSQWDNMLKLISKVLKEYEIGHIFINGSLHTVSAKIRKFKLDSDINVVLMSSDKSPSGLNLTEASTIILLDSLNTTKENAQIIEEQAIGRAVRIGQTKQVNVKRFIMRNTIEHDFYIRNIET